MEVRPLEIVRVTLQMGSDDSAGVFVYPLAEIRTRVRSIGARVALATTNLVSKSREANS